MIQLVLTLVVTLLISGVGHAAEEAVESVVGASDHGHHDSGTDDADDDGCVPEDDCFGFVHNCSCCAGSFVALASAGLAIDAPFATADCILPRAGSGPPGVEPRVDRPPRP